MTTQSIPTYNQVMQALCRKSYPAYVEYVHQGRYKHGKFTRFLTQTVQEFIETPTGHAYDILIISVPPQHSKSMSITETLPSWYMGKYPMNRVIEVSYNVTFAKKFSRRNKEKIKRCGKEIFGIEIGDTDTAEEFVLSNGIGSYMGGGVDGGITGNPAELFLIDDPIKNRKEADSQTYRDTLIDEWLNSYKSRLANGAKVIVVMTRWHKNDLAGTLMTTEKNVRVINFPIECETETDLMGRVKGELLFPEKPMGKGREWWEDFKASFINENGSRAMTSLYYGRPSNEEGTIFKRAWFTETYFDTVPKYAFKALSVDATFKDAKGSDFVAIQVWVKAGNHYYLIDKVKRIMSFTETIREIDRLLAEHKDYQAIYIEDKANGSAIIDVLNQRYDGVIPIKADAGTGNKEARASAVAPIFEARQVHVRTHDQDLIDEFCDFPNADHDDQVDCGTQCINRLRNVNADIIEDDDGYNDIIPFDDQINDIVNYR